MDYLQQTVLEPLTKRANESTGTNATGSAHT
jgi:hypothetical protein